MGELGYDYSGCHVVVTGGTSGAGLAIARGFRDFGAKVTITGREYLTSYYDADLARFRYVQLDLTDPDSIIAAAKEVGPVDVLVNAAPPGVPSDVAPADEEFLVQATQLGLIGPIQLATRLRVRLTESRAGGGGSVVNAPATRQWFELTHPVAPEVELAKVTQRLGASWVRYGVRVNSITAEPVIQSPVGSVGIQIDAHSGPLLTRTKAPTVRKQPDVTDLVLFLGSRGAGALTGQTLTAR